MPDFSELIARRGSKKIYKLDSTLSRPDGGGGVETLPLRICTHGIIPSQADDYYLPVLAGVPNYRISISQLARNGRAVRSYGSVDLITTGGDLDTELDDWEWDGRPVSISLGFDELHTSQYQPVITGRWDLPQQVISTNGEKTGIRIVDYQADLLNTTIPEGEYTETVPNLVSGFLTTAGITDIDSTLWSAWAAENNFAAWIKSNDDSAATLLQRLIPPLSCYYNFNRAGQFIVGTIKAPDAGTPELYLNDEYDETIRLKRSFEHQYWRIVVEYLTQPDRRQPGIRRADRIGQRYQITQQQCPGRGGIQNPHLFDQPDRRADRA